MKVINIKMKPIKRKIPSKVEKQITLKHPCRKLHHLELFAYKSTKFRKVKIVKSSEQINENLIYIMLTNLESFQHFLPKVSERSYF